MSNWAVASCAFTFGGLIVASLALGLWLKHTAQTEPEFPTPRKSRILGLSRRGKFTVFYFDEPERPSFDRITGRCLLNGWTYDELAEVAQRPKEWL